MGSRPFMLERVPWPILSRGHQLICLPPSAETQLAAGGAGRFLHAHKVPTAASVPLEFGLFAADDFERGRTRRQTKPSLRPSSSTFPLLILDPAAQHAHAKARGFGRLHVGSALLLSCQAGSSPRSPEPTRDVNQSRPVGFESAQYLAPLVASS